MPALALKLTDAGLAAVQAASGSDPTVIAELALTNTPFDYAPTLTALPGEFKRLPVTSGTAAAPNVTHLTVYDTSTDVWSATGLGLFLDDGTLFAVYASATPLLGKASLAFALLAFDIAFNADLAANIAYGNALFAYPPATEAVKGVAEVATQAETDAGTDDARMVTPLKLASRLSALLAPISASVTAIGNALTALLARTITGGGLVTGGGDLTANRMLTVPAASGAEALARALATKAVTPAALTAFVDMAVVSDDASATCWRLTFGGANYYLQMGKGTLTGDASTTVTFPQAYATKAYFLATGNAGDVSNEGNCAQSTWTLTEGTIVNKGNPAAPYTWVAFGW